MDSYSYAISFSSSNSSSTCPQQVKKNTKLPSYHSSLHGVRKLPTKPMTKLPIAPLPPTPPKIYRVEPNNFKDVVQMLTSSPEFQSVSNDSISRSDSGSSSFNSRRLQNVAPPPLDLSPVSLQRNNNIDAQWRECIDLTTYDEQERSHVTPRIPSENYFGLCSPLANFPLSPSSFAWCSSILLSPGTLTSPSALPTKPMTKLPIAPLPPTPPKIYRVEPNNFKDVVQMLTSSPEFQSVSNDSISRSDSGSSSFNSRRLQNVAPPPLDLSPVSLQRSNDNNNNNNNVAQWCEFLCPSFSSNINQVVESIETCIDSTNNEAQERSHVTPRIPSENYFGSCSPLANFPLSPASFAWCSSILLSPGPLTPPSAVL
ncbi:hypothetical protein H5410_044622 [Solanum commersonii]|uniref:VQ domain-containing protein n=1 Tax=Solanum commersonii TaxID=4109 RepID=A0A9J5XAF7_SOLCO|nr:hypothetical protein H5410_044622 [Solanum commersonii]